MYVKIIEKKKELRTQSRYDKDIDDDHYDEDRCDDDDDDCDDDDDHHHHCDDEVTRTVIHF